MTEFNLVSPTNAKKYTMEDVLGKLKDRACVSMDKLTISGFTPKCRYGSRDALLTLDNLRVSSSLWCNSLGFAISLEVPVHFTKNGKFSFGAETSDENIDNPYHGMDAKGTIKIWIDNTEVETVEIDYKFIVENYSIFVEIIYIAISTSVFKTECLDESIENIEMF